MIKTCALLHSSRLRDHQPFVVRPEWKNSKLPAATKETSRKASRRSSEPGMVLLDPYQRQPASVEGRT